MLTLPLQFWKSGKEGATEETGVVPEEWLTADIKQGISSHDVETRRKRFGWNEISTEKENMFLKFLSFFTGPILYGKPPQPPIAIAQLPDALATRNASLKPVLLFGELSLLPSLELRPQSLALLLCIGLHHAAACHALIGSR